MAYTTKSQAVDISFTPDSNGDFELDDLFDAGDFDHVVVSATAGQVITARAQKTGSNVVSGRAMRVSSGQLVPATGQIVLTFVAFWN